MEKAPLLDAAAQNGVNSSEQVGCGRERPEKKSISGCVQRVADARDGYAGLWLHGRVRAAVQKCHGSSEAPVGQGHVLKHPEQPNYHAKKKATILRDGRCSAMEGLTPLMVKPQSPAHQMEDCMPYFGPVVTTEAHVAYAWTRNHTKNTAELSSTVEALSFLGLAVTSLVFSMTPKHAADICIRMIHTRANVPLGLTSQQLLLQAQSRPYHHAAYLQSWAKRGD